MPFNSETASKAGSKSKRGLSKSTMAVKDLLSPHVKQVAKPFLQAAKNGEPWAVKLFFEYLYGKPKQTVDVTSEGERIEPPPIVFYKPDPFDLEEWDN